MFLRRRTDTRGLTTSQVVLTPERGGQRSAWAVVGLVGLAGALAFGALYLRDHLESASDVERLSEENRQLREDLGKARFDLEVEVATRSELERQVASLNEQLKRVSEELTFMKSAGSRRSGG